MKSLKIIGILTVFAWSFSSGYVADATEPIPLGLLLPSEILT